MVAFDMLLHSALTRIPKHVQTTSNRVRNQLVQRCQMSNTCTPDDDVLFTSVRRKALIVLNRPKQLNALNQSMIRKIYPVLHQWQNDQQLIVIKGNGDKAFCAGGDVVAAARSTPLCARTFFHDEYKLNGLISSLKVPYVALLNGIVMGGGVGLSIHGKYRVATEKTLFAMPETQIGLFPDVGVSHFLARMPSNLGLFLALTGYRLKGYDLYHTGIATHYCSSDQLGLLEKSLLSCSECPNVEEILNEFHCLSVSNFPNETPPTFSLECKLGLINHCFSGETVEKIYKKLQCDNSEFAKETHGIMGKMSPTSLKITLKQIKDALCLNLYECLNVDYRLVCRVLEEKEFYEGVRAQLIMKDKQPQWYPDKLDQISEEKVECYFRCLPPEEELNLPFALQSPCSS